jgi:F-box and leucine-rich repeat protein 1 (S-phase kinase-associated protein 2)
MLKMGMQVKYLGPLCEDVMVKICVFLDLSCSCSLRINRLFRNFIDTDVLTTISHVSGEQLYNAKGFSSLVPYLMGMTSLKIKRCDWLNDQSLEDLAKHCHALQELDVSGCQHISDAGISALAHGCPNLKSVDLTFCSQTTYTSVINLLDLCGPDVMVGP